MKSQQVKVATAVATGLVAVFLIWRQFSNPAANMRPSSAVGEVLAEEVARVLGAGGKVALISRQPLKDGIDASRDKLAAFEAALKRQTKVKLAPPDWLPRPPAGTMDLGVVTPEQFVAALEKTPDANAFVILAGMPPYSKAMVDQLTARSAKLIAVCGYTADVKRWLESKVLAVAIVPRAGDLPPGTPKPKTARDWLQQEFQVLTPETLADAPY